MQKITRFIFVSIFLILYSENLILGASFDCIDANTIREQTICKDPVLSKLDRQIGAIFQKLNKNGKYYEEINNRQKVWASKTRDFENHDFERHRDLLKFSSLFSICLEEKTAFKECYDKITKIDLQECMGDLTNYEMSQCMISFTEALNILEKVESEELVVYLKVEDPESVPFFNKARDSWLDYRSAECLLFYNFYRNGSIRSLMYTSCIDKKTFDRLEWIIDSALLD